jgi:hypothetical protein
MDRTNFKIGDRVTLESNAQLYQTTYQIVSVLGTLTNIRGTFADVRFDEYNSSSVTVFTEDMKLVPYKGEQLEFDFMKGK